MSHDFEVVPVGTQQEIERLRAQRDALLGALKAASNYIDVLGGVSKSYRIEIAKAEGKE